MAKLPGPKSLVTQYAGSNGNSERHLAANATGKIKSVVHLLYRRVKEERWFFVAAGFVCAVYILDVVMGIEVHGLLEILKSLSWVAVLYQALGGDE
jgi:hypothetical protein